jgi:hypothetical protein
LYAAAHVGSSNPPDPEINYQIEFSTDSGRTWQSLVRDWRIVRRGIEPQDFWSQSFCYGDGPLPDVASAVRVRFRNDGGKRYLRAEAHLTYQVPEQDPCRITFAWSDDDGTRRTAEHTFAPDAPAPWSIATGRNVRMHSVEFAPAPSR